MKTELELIYTIWDVVRGGQFNQDDPINERLMRQFLSIHRGRTLDVAYKKGDLIAEECFQNLGTISFSQVNGEYVSTDVPKIIRLRHSAGFMMEKDGYVIPVVNSLEYQNAKYDRFNKFQPKMKFINRKVYLYLGQEQIGVQIEDLSNSPMNTVVAKFAEEARLNNVTASGLGILVNTDDEVGYDFTKTAYPMPDELIENLINSVNAREFNIFLKMRSDEVGDNRNNTAEFNTREEL